MDIQRDIIVKKEVTESALVLNSGVILKQEPLEQYSVESYVFNSEMYHTSHNIDKKPEASLSTYSLTLESAGIAPNDGNNTHFAKIEPYEPEDIYQQGIEIDGIPIKPSYYNHDAKDDPCRNTQSNVSSEPTCDAVIKSQTTALEQETLAITQTTQHKLPASESSTSELSNTNTTVEYEDCNVGSNKNIKRKNLKKRNKSCVTRDQTCKFCPYKSKSKSALTVHIRIHTGERPFACMLCPYTCTSNTALISHKRVHTGEKPFECKHCQSKFFRKNHLKDHEKIHTGEKPFNCELCPYKCVKNSSLTIHMRMHTGEKPYACSVCNKQFKRKRNLTDHVRTHSGERPYACTLCDNKFRQSNHLLVHMRSHTGEKPYSCELCDYRCSVISYLKTHIRTHTGEKPFACNVCDYRSARKSCLVRHMTTHTV